eukprot:scaffold8446_cov90-Cylindrotheca_fusiformis.AAC.1
MGSTKHQMAMTRVTYVSSGPRILQDPSKPLLSPKHSHSAAYFYTLPLRKVKTKHSSKMARTIASSRRPGTCRENLFSTK